MRVFAVLSGKGGVGKTTTVANLGAALAAQGRSVVAVDANWTTPNLGYHLSIDGPAATLDEVLAGRRALEDALLPAAPGLRCLLPSPGAPLEPPPEGFPALLRDLRGLEADFVLLDCPPGLEPVRSIFPYADGAIVVTNPELPAMADALVTVRQAREAGGAREVVVELNRSRWARPGPLEVARLCGAPVAATVPESRAVARSVAAGRPAVWTHPWSRGARSFRRAARDLARGVRVPSPAGPVRIDPWVRLESLQRRMVELSALRRGEVAGLLGALEDYRQRGLLSEAAYQELRRVNLARIEALH